MKYGKNLGILAFFIATIVLLSTSLFITPLSVNDADPSTYVIVPILMLPLFVLFTHRTDPGPKVGRKDILIGSAMFAAFILLTLFLRAFFSFYFVGFRVDLLVLPLAIAALAVLLFGAENLPKFKGVLLYSAFSSPPILLFIMESYSAFTTLNTLIVYGLLKPLISGVQYVAPIAISANGYYIGIGQTCVSIGTFMALALFLIPIAYFYDGKNSRKVAWVASGVALLFLLNLLRMTFVSYEWLVKGPSDIVALIHMYAGSVLFCAVVIAMMLAAGRYGLTAGEKAKGRRKRNLGAGLGPQAVTMALAFSFLYAYVTLGYAGAINVPSLTLSNQVPFNFTNAEIEHSVTSLLNDGNFSYFTMTSQDGTYGFMDLTNGTVNASEPIILIMARPDSRISGAIENGSTVVSRFGFLNKEGVDEDVSYVVSNGTGFYLYHTSMPFVLKGMSSSVAMVYLIIPSAVLRNEACAVDPTGLYDTALNAFNAESYNRTAWADSVNALCVSERIVWS